MGTYSEFGSIKLDRFGQRVLLTTEQAEQAQRGGCALLAEVEFQSFGFTEDDLRYWANPFEDPFDIPPTQSADKAAFLAKQGEVRAYFAQLHQTLRKEQV